MLRCQRGPCQANVPDAALPLVLGVISTSCSLCRHRLAAEE